MRQRLISRVVLAAFALALAVAPLAHAATMAAVDLTAPHHATHLDDSGTADADDSAAPTALPNHCPDVTGCSLWTVLAGDLTVPANAPGAPTTAPIATPWTRTIPPDRHPPRLTA
jgi:hypothetical protein